MFFPLEKKKKNSFVLKRQHLFLIVQIYEYATMPWCILLECKKSVQMNENSFNQFCSRKKKKKKKKFVLSK